MGAVKIRSDQWLGVALFGGVVWTHRADSSWPSADAGPAAEGRGDKSRQPRSNWAGCLLKARTLGVGVSTVQRVKAEMPVPSVG
jgi:hypothetical protein